uniref:Uncharacterized protein n=1 Tax=Heterorhabditis bacteriophora TaxID=37862 RepID=A0A1I7WM76_HETBA
MGKKSQPSRCKQYDPPAKLPTDGLVFYSFISYCFLLYFYDIFIIKIEFMGLLMKKIYEARKKKET